MSTKKIAKKTPAKKVTQTKIKGCPFCGATPSLVKSMLTVGVADIPTRWFAQCVNIKCPTTPNTRAYNPITDAPITTKEQAIKLWNTRS